MVRKFMSLMMQVLLLSFSNTHDLISYGFYSEASHSEIGHIKLEPLFTNYWLYEQKDRKKWYMIL